MRNWDELRETLSRYYEGETSIQEEQALKEALREADLPDDLRAEAVLLGWSLQEQNVKAPVSEQEIWHALPVEKPAGRGLTLYWQWAAAVALLVMGYAAGVVFNNTQPASPIETATELSAMRQELTSLKNMLHEGATTGQRLQAVTVAAETARPDAELLMALIHTMHFDDNVNVRLAAVEALLNYRQHPQVRQALVHSLGIQTDANVQLMLIRGLTQMKETEAVPQMQALLQQDSLQQVVRHQLTESIAILL